MIVWVVGNSRNRDNWQLTTVKQLRNVLRLITVLAFEPSRNVMEMLDLNKVCTVFKGCGGLIGRYFARLFKFGRTTRNKYFDLRFILILSVSIEFNKKIIMYIKSHSCVE